MLSDLKVFDSVLKSVSTVAPDKLLLDTSYVGIQTFLKELKTYSKRLSNDYDNFVIPLCDSEGDFQSTLTLCVKFAYVAVTIALDRLMKAYETYLRGYQDDDRAQLNARFFSSVLLPSQDTYHHVPTGLHVASDAMHSLFFRCFFNHLNHLCEADVDYPTTTTTTQEAFINHNGIAICTQDAFIDAILHYCAMLSSYPVLPINLIGSLAPTIVRNDLENLQLFQPGVESRSYVEKSTDPRTCVSCKVDNLFSGETDKVEQKDKHKCQCLFTRKRDGFFESSYKCRAQALIRMMLIRQRNTTCEVQGCCCADHNLLFKEHMKEFKYLLDKARVE